MLQCVRLGFGCQQIVVSRAITRHLWKQDVNANLNQTGRRREHGSVKWAARVHSNSWRVSCPSSAAREGQLKVEGERDVAARSIFTRLVNQLVSQTGSTCPRQVFRFQWLNGEHGQRNRKDTPPLPPFRKRGSEQLVFEIAFG